MTAGLPIALMEIEGVFLWGLAATAVMTTILMGSQGLGLSRLSLPFIVGAFFTADRGRAMTFGFLIYIVGGWLFALLYFMVFARLPWEPWMTGTALGVLHGLFLLVVVLPVLHHLHPRMASEHDGPVGERRLEPPGFLGLNYGWRTPFTTLLGHVSYGAVLGALHGL